MPSGRRRVGWPCSGPVHLGRRSVAEGLTRPLRITKPEGPARPQPGVLVHAVSCRPQAGGTPGRPTATPPVPTPGAPSMSPADLDGALVDVLAELTLEVPLGV